MDVSQIPADAATVAKSDTAPCNGVGFMVDVAGDVAVTTEKGTVLTLKCLAGVQYALRISKIMSTNTTATGLTVFR